jgi:hypothetical protein
VPVNPESILPTSGSIIRRRAITQNFAQVTDHLSDLQSQHAARFVPDRLQLGVQWSATYVWQKVVDETRGFGGGNTGSDPYLTQWARGDRDARHQVTYNVGYTFHQAVSVTAFGRFQSGNPFTPMVSGDVNGDGYNNDRAFVYDPSKITDPTFSAAMQNLLTKAPSSVRDCLRKQLGTVAGKNTKVRGPRA